MSRNSKYRRDAKKKKVTKDCNRLKSKDKNFQKKISSDPVMTMMENPFLSLSEGNRKELISELGRQGKEQIIEIFHSLNKILRKYDPLTLISTLSVYGLTVGVDDKGVQSKEPLGSLHQAHVELIQALSLKIPKNELGVDLVTPSAVEKTWDLLIQISHAFKFSRMNVKRLEDSDVQIDINFVQELIRGHTQMVRNWGFHSQVVTISKEIYSHFDPLIQDKLGFSASNAIDIFKVLIELTEDKLSERSRVLSELKSLRKPYDMLVKYHELIGQEKEKADEFVENIDISRLSHKNIFFMMLAHYDLRISDVYFVDRDEIHRRLNIDEEIINNVLKYFSYAFGELSDQKEEFFFLDNPVWKKPIIYLHGEYYCPLPQLFFSFILNTLDEIVESLDKNALHKRRSEYLESKIEKIVKTRFPESQVISGVKWALNGVQYETDLIAFIDSHAIIIEAKSQKISKPALRGAPDSIKKHLKEVLIEPGVQSYRLEQKLNEVRAQRSSDDPLLKKLPTDIFSIKNVLRVSVSLEDFATLQSNLSVFEGTGWISDDFVPCPSMNLADFETLFDFLEHPVQIVHYLQRRTELEGQFRFVGDELDYIGLYITTLLNVGHMIDYSQEKIIITGTSAPLDKYYMSKDQGILIDKPQPKISLMFKNILYKLEERATPRWTEIGSILNRFHPEHQNKISKYIRDLSKVVNKTGQNEGHKNILVYNPDKSSEYALAIVLFKNDNRNQRNEFIDHASALGLEPEHVRRCLILAINIDDSDQPYHYIALVEKQKENPLGLDESISNE